MTTRRVVYSLVRVVSSVLPFFALDGVTTSQTNTFSIPENTISGTGKVPDPSQYFSNT